MLAAGLEVGHERDVDEERVPLPLLERDLAYGLQEGLALNVADGAAYLGYDDVGGGLLAQGVDELLYLVRHMGDYLHCRAQILAAPLLIEDVPVHAARGEVREAVQILVYEALVVPEVEVGLGPVLGDVDLAVLVRAHRARVHVNVGVELLRGDLEAPRLQQPSQRGGRYPLPQPGDDASGDENVLWHD